MLWCVIASVLVGVQVVVVFSVAHRVVGCVIIGFDYCYDLCLLWLLLFGHWLLPLLLACWCYGCDVCVVVVTRIVGVIVVMVVIVVIVVVVIIVVDSVVCLFVCMIVGVVVGIGISVVVIVVIGGVIVAVVVTIVIVASF